MGALIMLAYNAYSQKRNMLRVQYGDWRKLNLILDQIDKNYVDTINVGKVTDAAITAALAELDPHSVYMPPVELTEAETDLAGNEGSGRDQGHGNSRQRQRDNSVRDHKREDSDALRGRFVYDQRHHRLHQALQVLQNDILGVLTGQRHTARGRDEEADLRPA